MTTPEEEARLEAGRWLFAGLCEHRIAAPTEDALPPCSVPEVAFIGRSNVGKSSLINALAGRKGLARASGTPGCTRMLHFYQLSGRMFLVDVPGYGFHKASKKEQKGWDRLIHDYLRGRACLRRAMLLVDSRHGLKPNDVDMMKFLDDLAVSYQIILTKADQIKPAEREAVVAATLASCRKHSAAMGEVLLTSAEKTLGIPEARAAIAEVVG